MEDSHDREAQAFALRFANDDGAESLQTYLRVSGCHRVACQPSRHGLPIASILHSASNQGLALCRKKCNWFSIWKITSARGLLQTGPTHSNSKISIRQPTYVPGSHRRHLLTSVTAGPDPKFRYQAWASIQRGSSCVLVLSPSSRHHPHVQLWEKVLDHGQAFQQYVAQKPLQLTELVDQVIGAPGSSASCHSWAVAFLALGTVAQGQGGVAEQVRCYAGGPCSQAKGRLPGIKARSCLLCMLLPHESPLKLRCSKHMLVTYVVDQARDDDVKQYNHSRAKRLQSVHQNYGSLIRKLEAGGKVRAPSLCLWSAHVAKCATCSETS